MKRSLIILTQATETEPIRAHIKKPEHLVFGRGGSTISIDSPGKECILAD
jgi:hypothetical protein